MKKIIILAAAMIIGINLNANAACPIDKLGTCTADMSTSNFNNGIQDKIIPNRLDKIKQPNSTFDNRTNQGQSHTPENINMEPIQKENTRPYNANCQFGNCLNRTNSGVNNKN